MSEVGRSRRVSEDSWRSGAVADSEERSFEQRSAAAAVHDARLRNSASWRRERG